MLSVVALGGNALLKRGEPLTAERQLRNIRLAARALADLTKYSELVITHGNGPQVGLLALQGEAYTAYRPIPWTCWGRSRRG
jgi:carbamate kinase